ncbi:hypothetical protein Tco_1232811 [Tanacetum coccineum]
MSPSYSNNVHTKSYEDVSLDMRQPKSFDNVIAARQEGIMASPQLDGKSLKSDSTGPISSAMYANWSELVMHVNELGNKALLFNSHLRLFPGKLKSRWYGPFSVSKDMKNRAIKLYDKDGSEFIVNKQCVKPYQKDALNVGKDDDITLEDEGEVT